MRLVVLTAVLVCSACVGSSDPHSSPPTCDAPHGTWSVEFTSTSNGATACTQLDLIAWDFEVNNDQCMLVSSASSDGGCHVVQRVRCSAEESGQPTVRDATLEVDYAGPGELTGTVNFTVRSGGRNCDGTSATPPHK
jgi:hypothetical protein